MALFDVILASTLNNLAERYKEEGRYADAEGPVYVDAVASVTDQVNTVIKRTAADTDSGYVDLRAIFKGPDYDSDETPYLASDGDHPNAAGHQKIAAAVIDVVSQSLHCDGR